MPPESRLRAWWLTAVPGLVGAMLLVLLGIAPFLQALAALVLVFLPTYLIAWPVLYRRLGSAAALTIAGGVSIGSVALAGLALNLLPWGLQAVTWLAYVVVLLGLALVFGRRQRAWRPKLKVARHEVVLSGIGAMLMVSALLFARAFAGDPAESFTELSITASAAAPSSSVDLAILSQQEGATSYRLEVWLNGSRVKAWADIRLAASQGWSERLTVGTGRIEARLYRLDDPEILYRYVTLQVVPGGGASAGPGA
jgi:hypothetical protein